MDKLQLFQDGRTKGEGQFILGPDALNKAISYRNYLYILIRHHRRPDGCRDKQRDNGDGQTLPAAEQTKFMQQGTRLDEINWTEIHGMKLKNKYSINKIIGVLVT
jgi:hypothetical protein